MNLAPKPTTTGCKSSAVALLPTKMTSNIGNDFLPVAVSASRMTCAFFDSDGPTTATVTGEVSAVPIPAASCLAIFDGPLCLDFSMNAASAIAPDEGTENA